MDNLPNSKQDNQSQPPQSQPVNNGPIYDTPSKPGINKPFGESSFVSETPKTPEKMKNTEVIPNPEFGPKPGEKEQTQEDQNEIATLAKDPEEAKVVDKTDQITTLHDIKNSTDSLTIKADKDEEEFIEGVEKRHGHV